MSKDQHTNNKNKNRVQIFKAFRTQWQKPEVPEYSSPRMRTELFRALKDQPLYNRPRQNEDDKVVDNLRRMIKIPSSFGTTMDYSVKENIISSIFASTQNHKVITILLSQHRAELIEFFGDTKTEDTDKTIEFFIDSLFQYALNHPNNAHDIMTAFIGNVSEFFELKRTNNAIFKKFIQDLNYTILQLQRLEHHNNQPCVGKESFIQIKEMLNAAYFPQIEDQILLRLGKYSVKDILIENCKSEEFVLSSQLISELLSRVYTTYASSDQQKIVADAFYKVLKDIFTKDCNKYQPEINVVQKMIKYVLSEDNSFIKLMQPELTDVFKSERDIDILANGKMKEIICIYGISNYLTQRNDEQTKIALEKYIGGLFAQQITYKCILGMQVEFGKNPALNLSTQDKEKLAQYFEQVVERILSNESDSKDNSKTATLQCDVSPKTFDQFIKFINGLIIEDYPAAQLIEEEQGNIYDGDILLKAYEDHEQACYQQQSDPQVQKAPDGQIEQSQEYRVFEQDLQPGLLEQREENHSEVGALGQCTAPRNSGNYDDILEY